METQRLRLVVATIEPVESLIKGESSFAPLYDQVADGYIEFPEALTYMLETLKARGKPDLWGAYLFIEREERTLIGIGGYKGEPDAEGSVEIGYGIAREYRGRGYATEAAQALIAHAFADTRVALVTAHTLAEKNASGAVLTRCGMTRVAEIDDPDDGKIWRWELYKSGTRG